MKKNSESVKKHAQRRTGGARAPLTTFSRTTVRAAWAVLLMLPAVAFAQGSVDWTVGDVFVATGNGSYQIFHSINPTAKNPVYTNIQSINDGLGGVTSGCAFDTGYRLFSTNFTNTDIVRFTIDNAHGIAQSIPGGATTNFKYSESTAFDGQGNFYVGYAGTTASLTGGGLEKYDHAGTTLKGSFTPTAENGGVDWLDVAQDGHTVFYTSKGRKIFMFDTMNPGAGSLVYADLSLLGGSISSGKLFAIRVVPSAGAVPGSAGVFVADQANVKLVKSTCTAAGCTVQSVQMFKFTGETDLEALSLDPTSPSTTFWVGDHTTGDALHFNITKSKPDVTLSTGAAATLGGICVEGGFSAGQINAFPAPATQTFALTPVANTVFFTSPFTGAKFTLTLADLQNNLTATLRDSLVDPSVAQSDQTVFTLIPGSKGAQGIAQETNMPCDTTLTSKHVPPIPNACEIFEFETNPNTGFTIENLQLDKPAALIETTPNLRMLRDFDEDFTDGVINYPLRSTSCSTCKSVFSANQQASSAADFICGGGFSQPSQGQDFVKNQTSAISFKFKVSPTNTSGSCQNNLTPTNLLPLMLITQTQPPDSITGIAPAPVNIPVIVSGGSGGIPLFILSGNTWQLQVKTTNMPAGFNYVATMIDLTQTIPSIGVSFNLQ